MAQMTFRFGELEAILADINGIPSVQRTSFQARLKDIQRHGLLRMESLPRGKAAAYGLRELALMAVAVEMCQFGLSGKRAVQVMIDDEYPLWMAVMMAARSIEHRPEVFNPGPGDVGNPPDRKLWGFSPDWNDNESTDPASVFLHFDPSVLAPWANPDDEASEGTEQEGLLTASETFFYAGIGIVRENLPRWTTGPTRRVALINVTKLVFDLAARIAGKDGLAVSKGFAEVAEDYIHRGDFNLDDWLVNVTKAMGMMVAADPDRNLPWVPLSEVVGPDEPLGRYIRPVEQVTPAGEPDYVKDPQRPDMIIRLPGHRELRVDDKVSPTADIPQAAIDWRLQELAEKPYHSQFADNTDWTVLYLPSDTFFANAMAADRFIIEKALHQNVLIATPSIFMNLLVEVDKAWTKYREEIPDLANDEWEYLPEEHRPDLETDYVPDGKLPKRVPYSERKANHGDR